MSQLLAPTIAVNSPLTTVHECVDTSHMEISCSSSGSVTLVAAPALRGTTYNMHSVRKSAIASRLIASSACSKWRASDLKTMVTKALVVSYLKAFKHLRRLAGHLRKTEIELHNLSRFAVADILQHHGDTFCLAHCQPIVNEGREGETMSKAEGWDQPVRVIVPVTNEQLLRVRRRTVGTHQARRHIAVVNRRRYARPLLLCKRHLVSMCRHSKRQAATA